MKVYARYIHTKTPTAVFYTVVVFPRGLQTIATVFSFSGFTFYLNSDKYTERTGTFAALAVLSFQVPKRYKISYRKRNVIYAVESVLRQ